MALRTYIVEDQISVRQGLTDMLYAYADADILGWADSETRGVAELAALGARWDVVLVDLALAEGSGVGVLKACRTRHPHQKVIVLTNYATTISRDACLARGADRVFDKTTELEAMLDYLGDLIGN
jgi:DNA-binding NarL/FixJ family response regulator